MSQKTVARSTIRKAEQGFTLVEVMVSLVILAIGILGVGQLLITSQRHSNFGRQQTIAVSLAQEIKERIYSEDFDNIKSVFDGADTDVPASLNSGTSLWASHVDSLLGTNGRGTVLVFDDGDDVTIPPGMVRVDIAVSWIEGPLARNHGHTFMLSKVGL